MEQQQRQKIVKALNKLKLDAISVENPALPGTPDVNYIGGWMELKYIRDWPKRDSTTVRLDHFTQQQRIWLIRRWMNFGQCWLCLQVSKTRDWFLFTGKDAGMSLAKDGCNKAKVFELASFHGHSADEIADYIIKDDNAHFSRLS